MKPELDKKALEVLEYNDLGKWTRPAPDLYPHQWLWDSCFIAIGLRHHDVKRARTELISLFRGQWANGMMPHTIFFQDKHYHLPASFWESRLSPYAPEKVATSGITQPPVLAIAIAKVGEKMKKADRLKFYKEIYPSLLDYHAWLYRERNPQARGLAILIHPWESGMDNNPAWVEAMHTHHKPWWISAIEWTRLDKVIERFRRDTRQVPPDERSTTVDSLMLMNVVRRLRRKHYDTDRVLPHSHFIIEDLLFNSVLIRANEYLKEIAKEIGEKIPRDVLSSMNKAGKSLEELWDEETKQYYPRMYVTGKLIKEPTIASLMPLYSKAITKKRAETLVKMLEDKGMFGANYPVPSVPLNSKYFNHRKYWQGPTWVNTNWLIIEGLESYGFKEQAEKLRETTVALVERSGFFEYFSPVDGYGAGIAPFSWTAALTIDLLHKKSK